MSDSFPSQGRIAGIDFGEVRIGIAISDASRTLASPLENYTRRGIEADARHFRELVAREQLVGFVVGLPVHASGAESRKSEQARRFGRWLGEVTERPVRFFDERYSTTAAESLLGAAGLTNKKRKKRRDMLAAQIILTAFLESAPGAGESTEPIDDAPS